MTSLRSEQGDVIRRDVVDNEVTGHIRTTACRVTTNDFVVWRRNAVPCLRSEQGDVIHIDHIDHLYKNRTYVSTSRYV